MQIATTVALCMSKHEISPKNIVSISKFTAGIKMVCCYFDKKKILQVTANHDFVHQQVY